MTWLLIVLAVLVAARLALKFPEQIGRMAGRGAAWVFWLRIRSLDPQAQHAALEERIRAARERSR